MTLDSASCKRWYRRSTSPSNALAKATTRAIVVWPAPRMSYVHPAFHDKAGKEMLVEQIG